MTVEELLEKVSGTQVNIFTLNVDESNYDSDLAFIGSVDDYPCELSHYEVLNVQVKKGTLLIYAKK